MTTKTLMFKIARFNNEKKNKTLQSLLETALKKRRAAISRRMPLDSNQHYVLINHTMRHQGVRVGEFFDYTDGQKQPLARLENQVEELEISSLAPPDTKSQFLHSILYFGVHGNSVILSQALSLRSKQFEVYINWLLTECKLLGKEDFVALSDQPPLSMQGSIANTKGIEFHAPVRFHAAGGQDRGISTTSIPLSPQGIGWDILKDILPKEFTIPSSLKANDIAPNAALEMKLFLSWKRLNKDDPTILLDIISNQLRHVDNDLDYTIHTRSGKITQDEIKLKKSVSVGTTTEGMIRRAEMWSKMHEWLHELIESDRIGKG